MVLLLVACADCGGSFSPEIPLTACDCVNNDRSIGIARVIGIDFSGNANSGGVNTESSIEPDFFEPEQTGARKRFVLGDDIPIQLDSINELEVRFMFDDQDCGALKAEASRD